jgi:biotin carboxylase
MTVLILGAGVMQIPAMRIAKELGWRVAAADGNAEAVGACVADIFFHVDLKDLAGLEAAARELSAQGGLGAVFTAGTDFSTSVAYLAGRLGLPGIPFEAAERASNKLVMRAALAAAGVPSPRFLAVDSGQLGRGGARGLAEAAGLGLPLVVKPCDSMGARGCMLVRGPEALDGAVADAIRYSRRGQAIVEEYMEGPEFSIDALVEGDEILIRGFADRHIFFAPYFVELGHTMPSACTDEVRDEVLRVFRAGVKALGLRRGAAKGDMKWCPARGTAMVGEIAARLSGGYMSGWTYPYASGIEVTRGALELAAGLPLRDGEKDRGWVSAERAFISIPGRVAELYGCREAEGLPYIKNVFYRVAPGDDCVFPLNNVQKCGNAISQAPNRAEAVASAEAAVASILIRLQPGLPSTDAFLRGEGRVEAGEGRAWPPEAFSLPPRAHAAIAALPGGDLPPPVAAASEKLPLLSLEAVLGPELAEEAGALRDWSGRGFLDSAELALRLGGGGFVDEKGGACALSGPFWRALARGGAQAALYVLDSARARGASA